MNGIYGIRPSSGSVQSSGLVLTDLMDTIGIFSRSAEMLEIATKSVISGSSPKSQPLAKSKFKLLYPVQSESGSRLTSQTRWFSSSSTSENESDATKKANTAFEKFTAVLERRLNCSRTRFSLEDLWTSSTPAGFSTDVVEANVDTYPVLVYGSLWRDVIKDFTHDYQKAHSGRVPYIEPKTRARLEFGSQVTDQQYDDAVKAFHMFANWVRDVLFATEDGEIPILIYPQSWGLPNYRDEPKDKDAPLFWKGFSLYSISYCSGCPDITVPVGEVSYHSRITDQDEHLPISMSILTKPGHDQLLLDLVHELEIDGDLNTVEPGERLFRQK